MILKGVQDNEICFSQWAEEKLPTIWPIRGDNLLHSTGMLEPKVTDTEYLCPILALHSAQQLSITNSRLDFSSLLFLFQATPGKYTPIGTQGTIWGAWGLNPCWPGAKQVPYPCSIAPTLLFVLLTTQKLFWSPERKPCYLYVFFYHLSVIYIFPKTEHLETRSPNYQNMFSAPSHGSRSQ